MKLVSETVSDVRTVRRLNRDCGKLLSEIDCDVSTYELLTDEIVDYILSQTNKNAARCIRQDLRSISIIEIARANRMKLEKKRIT